MEQGRLLGLEVKLRAPHLELLDGGLVRRTPLMGLTAPSQHHHLVAESLRRLTKDPSSWKVAFWAVTLKRGSGGLIHSEWSCVWENPSRSECEGSEQLVEDSSRMKNSPFFMHFKIFFPFFFRLYV